jgi:CBS domain containing-hemolysin-like protein
MSPFVAAPAVPIAGVAAIVVLLAVSAFFSASEIAFFSLAPHRRDELAATDAAGAGALGRLAADPHRLLVTILVGNNLVNVALASVTTALLARLVGPGAAIGLATVVGSTLVLLFGEIGPKSYAVANPERVALGVAHPLAAAGRLLHPLVVVFEAASGLISRLTGGSVDIERPYATPADVEALVRAGERVGTIGRDERSMVEGVFDLSTTVAREVMVPRADVVAVSADASLERVREICATNRLSRLPVYEGTIESVLGVVDLRDVERAVGTDAALRELLLPTLRVPVDREIDELFDEMRAGRVEMVAVYDEFGEFEGVITVEDILERIVGDVLEVGEERLVRAVDDGLVVRGEVTVAEVDGLLGTDLPRAGAYETVAGLINDELGRIGAPGDSVTVGGAVLSVEAVDGNRIRRVRIERLDGDDGGEREDGSGGGRR